MNAFSLPVGVFDLVLVGVLTIGVLRGRKQGMSEELLSLMKWLAVMFVCAAAYQPLGRIFVSNTSVFSSLSCYLMAYVAAALLVLIVFAGITSLALLIASIAFLWNPGYGLRGESPYWGYIVVVGIFVACLIALLGFLMFGSILFRSGPLG